MSYPQPTSHGLCCQPDFESVSHIYVPRTLLVGLNIMSCVNLASHLLSIPWLLYFPILISSHCSLDFAISEFHWLQAEKKKIQQKSNQSFQNVTGHQNTLGNFLKNINFQTPPQAHGIGISEGRGLGSCIASRLRDDSATFGNVTLSGFFLSSGSSDPY